MFPRLAVAILAVLAFLYALERESLLASALCGLLVGLGVTIRVSNGAILIGMLAAALIVRPRRFQLAQALTFAVGFIALPSLQAWLNLHYLGSIFSNGYAFWLPAFYSSAAFKTFKLSYLFAPADPIYRHGNFVAYALAMLGIDGIFGQLHLGTESRTLVHARYSLFPFPVVVFAAMGVFWAMRQNRNASTMRALYLGLSFLAVLLIIYLPYFHVEPRFMLPALFIRLCSSGLGTGLRESKARVAMGRLCGDCTGCGSRRRNHRRDIFTTHDADTAAIGTGCRGAGDPTAAEERRAGQRYLPAMARTHCGRRTNRIRRTRKWSLRTSSKRKTSVLAVPEKVQRMVRPMYRRHYFCLVADSTLAKPASSGKTINAGIRYTCSSRFRLTANGSVCSSANLLKSIATSCTKRSRAIPKWRFIV